MKILWIVNIIFPFPSQKIGVKENNFGGWLNGLANKLQEKEDINLAIATVYNGKDILEYNDGRIIYYLIPGAPALKYKKELEKYWKIINERFKPDLVHIHGTEFTHGLAFINANPQVNVITSIQGLVSSCAEVYTANLGTKEILKNITLRDILRRDNIFQQKSKLKKRGKYEIKVIQKSKAIIGRTFWDYANVKAINNNVTYYKVNEILRDSFYCEEQWNENKIENNTIYFSQGGYPIKGLHILLEAVNILKKRYPNIKVYIGGPNIIKYETFIEKLKSTNYGKIIEKRIKGYNLTNHIKFVGNLNSEQVKKYMLKSNVYVLSSVIENESNSLSEASILGMPCVASYVGGASDRIEQNKTGLLYPTYEPAMLAECISKIFNDKSFAKNIGKNAREKYHIINDKKQNIEDLYKVYKKTYKFIRGENQ